MALPVDRSIPEEKFPEKLRRLVARDAPPQMRLSVARGQVPMPPVVQISALCHLDRAGDPELSAAVTDTLRRMPAATLRQVATEPLLPVVLDWMADRVTGADEVLEALVSNRQTDDETVARLARTAPEGLTEAVARNQERLLRAPEIIEALYYNRNTRASTADRVVDFAARNGVDLSHLPGFTEILAAIQGAGGPPPENTAQAAEADRVFREAKAATEAILSTQGEPDYEDEVQVEERSLSVAGRIAELNVAQKVRMALLGNRMERNILIRDSNKVVQRAVIRSPSVTDQEAMTYANNRSLPEEILQYIATNRQWVRHYQLKLNLVMNPRCPIAFALPFLKMLRANDLRAVARSKNVSSAIAKAAKQQLSGQRR